MTSRAWVPMEPVDPRMITLRTHQPTTRGRGARRRSTRDHPKDSMPQSGHIMRVLSSSDRSSCTSAETATHRDETGVEAATKRAGARLPSRPRPHRLRSPRPSSARRSPAARTCPKPGRVILASNHLSFIDSIVIPHRRASAGAVPRQVALLHRHRPEGLGLAHLLHRDRRRQRRARRRPGRPRRARSGQAHPRRRQRLRTLPGGNPLPRRPTLPRPHRHRLAGADHRRHRRARRPDRHAGDPAGRHASMPRCARSPSRSASRSTSRTTARPNSGKARRQATDEIMAAIHALTGQELAGQSTTRLRRPAPCTRSPTRSSRGSASSRPACSAWLSRSG